jgi:dTDP-4-dehydrorhamnose 3,5-epimerase
MSGPTIVETPIAGLLLVSLPVPADARGWSKENWQRENMVAAGLPDFGPVQQNVAFNAAAGTTRGIHAELWDKFVSVATGRVFGAWVDLRAGDGFGTVFTTEMGPESAVFVPRGVGNAYQTLEDATSYVYLVNDHWSPGDSYVGLNPADPALAVEWPIPLDRAVLGAKDLNSPPLRKVRPVAARRTLIVGANGQVGRALRAVLPDAVAWGKEEFDVADSAAYEGVDWRQYDTVINAAAYTAVDEAETAQGRRDAWRVNVHATVILARVALAHNLRLVHLSSDYVFDGALEEHQVDEQFSPLGVYGQTKAAADAVVMVVPRHYIVRTSWVIGEGHNFIATMKRLAREGASPSVVDDQVGRLSHTEDIATRIVELLDSGAPYGTYNVTSGGPPKSWHEIARDVFAAEGHDPDRVTPVSTAAYSAGKSVAPRPRFSTLAE